MSEEKTAKKARTAKHATQNQDEIVLNVEPDVSNNLPPKRIDPDMIVQVYNGYQGKLYYRSRKTGELFEWQEFGDYQDMELSELKNARSASKKFFVNNWFMFDEDWIVSYLGMERYYKNAVRIEDFDDLFDKPIDELTEILKSMSAGQKKSVAYRARQLIADNVIDSNKKILALEKCLGVDLVEH